MLVVLLLNASISKLIGCFVWQLIAAICFLVFRWLHLFSLLNFYFIVLIFIAFFVIVLIVDLILAVLVLYRVGPSLVPLHLVHWASELVIILV